MSRIRRLYDDDVPTTACLGACFTESEFKTLNVNTPAIRYTVKWIPHFKTWVSLLKLVTSVGCARFFNSKKDPLEVS